MKRILSLPLAVLTLAGSLTITTPPAPAHAETCAAVTAATRTGGTIQRVSATRIRVVGSTDYWAPAAGWAPLDGDTDRVTIQKQRTDGTWANINSVAPGKQWNVTGSAGVYRLAHLQVCTEPYAASSSRAVRITAPAAPRKKPKPGSGKRCDPNYAGACVPIASDVDCAGGSGNGPAYVQGPVRVIGTDIYDLDRDGDGIGCE